MGELRLFLKTKFFRGVIIAFLEAFFVRNIGRLPGLESYGCNFGLSKNYFESRKRDVSLAS